VISMRGLHSLPLVLLLFFLPGLSPARAQVLSKWGNPVISLGLTPYDAVSNGHGNYPGSNGFIPGYGYYPGEFPSRYPWLTGPKHDPPPVAAESPGSVELPATPHVPDVPADAALLCVRVPAEAEVWVDDHKTSQKGTIRFLVTPALQADRDQVYRLRVRWLERDQAVERVRTVHVQPGDRLILEMRSRVERTGLR
jgi:uncharacterized protein (TIGR03000 family)